MPSIHKMAVVESGAELAADVVVGAFAYVGPHVKLGKGCVVHHHAQIEGHTQAGEGNEFFPNCSLGGCAQDLKYRGGACRLLIGSRNKFRESVTAHIGTEDGGGETRIGDDNLFMVGAHIAHDCVIGSHVILANNVLLAGHVAVEDWVVISGSAAAHHFVTFGQHSFVGGMSGITHDVPPFMVVDGHPAIVRGVNRTGLKRRGFTDAQLEALKAAYRLLFRDTRPFSTQAVELEKLAPKNAEIKTLLAFMRESSNGRYGRAREAMRGQQKWEVDDEDQNEQESGK